ncbi:MAG: hypothetical protein ACRD96_09035, partial [Bryobacteraceae bacterium]
LTLEVRGQRVNGRYFRQEYDAAGGTPVGKFDNGKTAAVEHRFGQGRTLLIGTFPGAGYFRHHSAGTRSFFASLLSWAGVAQKVRSSDPAVQARLHSGDGGVHLWVANPTREARTVTIALDAKLGAFTRATDVWQKQAQKARGREIEVAVEDRNVAVIRLEP